MDELAVWIYLLFFASYNMIVREVSGIWYTPECVWSHW